MTRKDFNTIANVLRTTRPTETAREAYAEWRRIVRSFAAQLHTTNDGFDPAKFMTACGLGQ